MRGSGVRVTSGVLRRRLGRVMGFRSRRVQTAEGELRVEVPQVREAAEPFVSRLFPYGTRLLRTDPLKAMIVGAFVRGLSMRDVESLCEQAGLGKVSKSTASRVCAELHERFLAFCRRDLYDVKLVASCSSMRSSPGPSAGPEGGGAVRVGVHRERRARAGMVRLGNAGAKEDWLELGRDLTRRGLGSPMLVILADGAPGLIAAVEDFWPRADRQHCTVHRLRNLLAKSSASPSANGSACAAPGTRSTKPPASQTAPAAYQVLVDDDLTSGGYQTAAACLADDLPALVVHLRLPARHRKRWRSTTYWTPIGEVRRRTKVIGRFPGEHRLPVARRAVPDLFMTHASNGATFTDLDRQHLYRIRYQPAEPATPQEVTAA